MSKERKHHSYSPSTLQHREACPMWCGTGEGGEAATRGTMQHDVTETGEDNNDLTDEEIHAAIECMEYADGVKTKLEEKGLVEDHKEIYIPIDDRVWQVGVYDWKTETRSLHEEKGTTAGYVDRVLVQGKTAYVIDWKFGKWPVEDAENNLQGIAYALGVFKKFPQVTMLCVVFKQPHLQHTSQASFARYRREELELRVKTVVERAEHCTRTEDYAQAKPSIPTCLFCARKAVCPLVQAIALNVAKKFYPVEFPEEMSSTVLRDPKNSSIGMRLAQVAEAWAKGWRSRTADQVLLGKAEEPEGYRLEEYKKRQIVDAEVFEQVAKRYLSDEEFQATKKAGLTGTEKAISVKMPRGEKTAAVDEFKQAVEESGSVQWTTPVPFLRPVPPKTDTKKDKSNGKD